MARTNGDKNDGRPRLTKKRKRKLDQMLERLFAYFQTPEGIALGEAIREFNVRWRTRREENLTDRERRALEYIRSELSRGHSPSIREVTHSLGFTSSRTGFRVVETLTKKQMVARDNNGHLEIPGPLKM